MKSKRKMIAITVSLVLVIACLAGATIAYFTDNESVTNTLVVGNVDIDLHESQAAYNSADATTNKDALHTGDAAYKTWLETAGLNIVPGQVIAKNTYIENTGKNPAYVRFQVTVPGKLKDYVVLNFDGEGTDEYYDVTMNTPAADEDLVYTYTRIAALPVGEVTGNGLVSIKLKDDMTSDQLQALITDGAFDVDGDVYSFGIDVQGQAIQTIGFDDAIDAFASFDGTTGVSHENWD